MLMLCFLLLCVLCVRVTCSTLETEIDVSWEFNDEHNPYRSGWANASSELIDLTAREEGGELRCGIIGYNPKLDSPSLFLAVGNRHYLVMRARYDGLAIGGRLLLRSGASPSPREQLVAKTSYWSDRQPTVAIASSPPVVNSSMADAVDGNRYTIFRTNTATNAQITLDLGSFRWVTGARFLVSGDAESPRRTMLLRSTTSGVGPFEKVALFTLTNRTASGDIAEQAVGGFQGFARYWRIIFLDTHGSTDHTAVRDVFLDGYDERVTVVPFSLQGDGAQHMHYLPLGAHLSGSLLRMRFELLYPTVATFRKSNIFSENLAVDFIRIMRAPEVHKVRGCLDYYYDSPARLVPHYNVSSVLHMINTHLPIRSFLKHNMTLPYAETYDCPRSGGALISIEGINFGSFPLVTVANISCDIISVAYSQDEGRRQQILCRLPAVAAGGGQGPQRVRVCNGQHPGLFFDTPALSYRSAPGVPARPLVSNLAATKVDLLWEPPGGPGGPLTDMTVTAYRIAYFPVRFPHFVSNMTVGNVTTTSVRGLQPGTEYAFAIAAVAEGAGAAALPTDLYGRRDLLEGALIGEFSTFTNATATLPFDFSFEFFNSNQTLNSSSAGTAQGVQSDSNGPTGQFGSEGAYGLIMVGSANIENCNVSSTCCDGYNATLGVSSCGSYRSVCSVLPARMLASDFVINSVTRRVVPSNLPYANGAPSEISISKLEDLLANKGAKLPSSACGPALRLTPSEARQSGAVWYGRKMNVHEGFDTTVRFKISNPSQKCDRMDDVNTYCRSRGADGWAFVLQNEALDALGLAGSGLGYDGIFNALAVELDTYHNFEQLDYYENHISVMTQGFRYNISSNHSRSLATTNKVADLTDGEHVIRIKYDPSFDQEAVPHPSFQVNGFTTWFLNNADFVHGGEGDWGTGFGLLSVFLDDLYSPVLTTPLNLGATLKLDDGRSYVGLTAATGNDYWQAHDILSWQFSSLYVDEDYTAPLRVNGQGAHSCVNASVCVHPEDYEHYRRKNRVWGKGFDNTEGWMDGSQGFCADC